MSGAAQVTPDDPATRISAPLPDAEGRADPRGGRHGWPKFDGRKDPADRWIGGEEDSQSGIPAYDSQPTSRHIRGPQLPAIVVAMPGAIGGEVHRAAVRRDYG